MRKIFFSVIAAVIFCGPAQAFHPLVTEDTGLLARGQRQVELAFDHSIRREGTDEFQNVLGAEVSYGLGSADLLLALPWRGWRSGGVSESGPGDLSLEAKLAAGEAYGWTLAVKPGLLLPAGDDAKGLGAGKAGGWFYGVAGRTAGRWQYYLNAGFQYFDNTAGEEKGIFRGSAAAAYEAVPGITLSTELAAETNPHPEASAHPLAAALGLGWAVSPDLDLSAGARFGLNDQAHDLCLLAGATYRF